MEASWASCNPPSKSRQSAAHPFQIEDGSHLGKTGKLVADSPGGDCGEIGYERPQLLVELQTAKLWGPRELCQLSEQVVPSTPLNRSYRGAGEGL